MGPGNAPKISYPNAILDATFRNLILRQVRPAGWGVQLKLFTEALKDFETIRRVDATAHLELVFHCPRNPHASVTISKILSDLVTSGMHLDDITQIFFAEKIPGLAFETIANTFGKLPRVHSVVVAENAARSFLDAMNFGSHFSDPAGSSEDSAHLLSFPCLSLIYMYDMSFVEDHTRRDNSDLVSTELLRHTLLQRRNLGAAIETLVLIACFEVFEEDIKLLEEIVTKIEWDAFEYLGGDEEEKSAQVEEEVEEDESSDSESSTDAHSSP